MTIFEIERIELQMEEKNEHLDFHIPRWNELPDIDLYVDQVITLFDNYLSNYH